MSFKDYVSQLYQSGDLSLLYDTELFSYDELKDIFINGDENLKHEILNINSHLGNNLFLVSLIAGDFDMFKELFPRQKNTPLVINNLTLIAHLESFDNITDIEVFLIEKFNNKELNLTAIGYADAYLESLKFLYRDELKINHKGTFIKLYKLISSQIETVWNEFDLLEKTKFIFYIENRIKGYENYSFFDPHINRILDLEKDKKSLFEFILTDNLLISDSYLISNTQLKQTIFIDDLYPEIINFFDKLNSLSVNTLLGEAKALARITGKFDLSIKDINCGNSLIFKKLIALSLLFGEISESPNFSQNKTIRCLARNYAIEPSDNKINSSHFLKQLEATQLPNMIVDKRSVFQRNNPKLEFNDSLINNIEEFPSFYAELLKFIPVFVECDLNNTFYDLNHLHQGRVEEISNFPVAISIKEPRKDLIIHELTHVLQKLSYSVGDKIFGKNEKWKKIHAILKEGSNISENELVDSITNLLKISQSKKTEFQDTLLSNLKNYLKTNIYDYNTILKIEGKSQYNKLIESIFVAYREQLMNKANFLPTLWKNMDGERVNSLPYFGSSTEIHARLSELTYCSEISLPHKIITVGIKPGVIEKLRPLVEELNNEIFHDVKEHLVRDNIEETKLLQRKGHNR